MGDHLQTMKLTDLVPMPAPTSANGGKSPCPTSFLERKYGRPRSSFDQTCRMPTVAFWKSRMVTENVGPFKVTGHRLAVKHLREGLAELKTADREVYDALGHVGMLCCRYVRGSKRTISNHSFGLAIDFTLNGILDSRGDDKVQSGLFRLYGILKKHGFYWGVEFGTEDAMHFELCGEVVMDAIRRGEF